MSDRRPAALTPLFTCGLDFQKVLRRISHGAGRPRATSSLVVDRFAAKKGWLRSPRGRLVASLRAAQSREFSRLPQMKSLLAGYVRLRSHSRRSLLGECSAKFLFPVHISLHCPSIQSERTVHPVLRRISSHQEANALFLESSYFTDDVHTVYHVHHSNPSHQTTVHYLVSVLARIRFKHLCKCNCKLLDLKKGLPNSCVYQIIQRLATGRFCQEIGTYSCYFSFD